MHLLQEGRTREGIDQLKAAAAQDHAEAQLFMAEIIREGKLVPRDWPASLAYYEQAAAKGSLPALRFLALTVYAKGIDGVRAPVRFFFFF